MERNKYLLGNAVLLSAERENDFFKGRRGTIKGHLSVGIAGLDRGRAKLVFKAAPILSQLLCFTPAVFRYTIVLSFRERHILISCQICLACKNIFLLILSTHKRQLFSDVIFRQFLCALPFPPGNHIGRHFASKTKCKKRTQKIPCSLSHLANGKKICGNEKRIFRQSSTLGDTQKTELHYLCTLLAVFSLHVSICKRHVYNWNVSNNHEYLINL